jgi:protein TonB
MTLGTARAGRRWPAALRWSACLTAALSAHALAFALIAHWSSEWTFEMPGGLPIAVALAPVPVAPEAKANDASPAPTPSQAAPSSQAQDAAREEPPHQPEVVTEDTPPQEHPSPLPDERLPAQLAVLPPVRPALKEHEVPAQKTRQRSRAGIEGAPPHADRKATLAAALTGVAAHDPAAVPDWKARLVAQIERHKRYPAAAEAHGEQGTAQVAFSVDRRGGVHGARLVHSTGSPVLDGDALAWLARAAPLPPPPPEVSGALIPLVVPLRYRLN